MTCKMMHQIWYDFYWSIMVEIGPKNWIFGSSWEVYCICPLTPYELRPRFCQMKKLIKIHIRGNFYQYSVCGCEAKNFQGFLYRFGIHEMVPFWVFLGSHFPKCSSILLKFWPEFISNKTNNTFIYTFWMPSFSFWVFAVRNFTQKNQLLFLVQDPVRPILRGLGAITSVSKVRWKRNFDYR